jgi:hypothetical protein
MDAPTLTALVKELNEANAGGKTEVSSNASAASEFWVPGLGGGQADCRAGRDKAFDEVPEGGEGE